MKKTIYILWFQGFDQAPEIVKRCLSSWKHYNPDWEILELDQTNLHQYISDFETNGLFQKPMEKCHLSDIIRCLLLDRYGGLWVDATTFCNKSLNEWLPQYIQEGFFAFDRPGSDRMISNWFLYAEKSNDIIHKWCQSTLHYYSIHEKAETYFIHHYLFVRLYLGDVTFRTIWDCVPKLPASGHGPHFLSEQGLFQPLTESIRSMIDQKRTPLYKLSYKYQFPEYDENLNLYYLYSTIASSSI